MCGQEVVSAKINPVTQDAFSLVLLNVGERLPSW